jgi:alkylhydroperoxidase family enzyme
MRRRILAVGGMVLLLAACGSGHHVAAPTTTTAPSPPTTADVNPDVVPPVITTAYLDAVLRVLDHLYGNATRSELHSRRLTAATLAYLRAIYRDPQYSDEVSIFSGAVGGASLDQLRTDPGDRVLTVASILTASPSCAQMRVTTNYAAVDVHPTPAAAGYIELESKLTKDDPGALNSTAWAISYEKTTPPARACAE